MTSSSSERGSLGGHRRPISGFFSSEKKCLPIRASGRQLELLGKLQLDVPAVLGSGFFWSVHETFRRSCEVPVRFCFLAPFQ